MVRPLLVTPLSVIRAELESVERSEIASLVCILKRNVFTSKKNVAGF